jgi:hypothetical protein
LCGARQSALAPTAEAAAQLHLPLDGIGTPGKWICGNATAARLRKWPMARRLRPPPPPPVEGCSKWGKNYRTKNKMRHNNKNNSKKNVQQQHGQLKFGRRI